MGNEIVKVNIVMLSNYDVLNSWDAQEINTQDEIIKMICKNLGVSPWVVNKLGKGEDYAYKQNYIDPKQLAYEFQNAITSTLFYFFGQMPLEELYTAQYNKSKILMPRGTTCGLFNGWQGGGSVLEVELLRDMVIDLSKPYGTPGYDEYRIQSDEVFEYTPNDVYGLSKDDMEFYSETFKIVE